MNDGLLNNLTDTLVEYIMRELSNYSTIDEGTLRRIKSAKLYIDDMGNGQYELRICMGISEASFTLNGQKVYGSIGSSIERLVSYWLTRPLNQAALASIVKS